MSEELSLGNLTREKLYELIWSTPATKIGEQFGVSAGAILHRCSRQGIPRPGRGYWAKLAAGKPPELPPLPPTPLETLRQAGKSDAVVNLSTQADQSLSHPIAAALLSKVKSASLGSDRQRVHLREEELPEAEISKTQAPRAAAAFEALLKIVEPRGILFKRSQSSWAGGFFRRGNDRMYIKIEEALVDKSGPAGRNHRSYAPWDTSNKVASGYLTFIVNPERYGIKTEMRWEESAKLSLEKLIGQMAKEMCRHFAERQRQRQEQAIAHEKYRIESEIRWKKYQEELLLRQQAEARQKHEVALKQAAEARKQSLLRAAELWRLATNTEVFVEECARRWQVAQSGELAPEQMAWLTWAREVANSMNPFTSNYPDPSCDGAFDNVAIPFGGPYPACHQFP
jgi:hypothetical protein